MGSQLGVALLGATALLLIYTNCSAPEKGGSGSGALQSATCSAPAGISSSPQNIEQAVALLNALPKPTTVPCFVQALSRPLDVYATQSTSSAQPAFSDKSPRLFIFKGPLVISVVPEGPSSAQMEFGVIKGTGRTLKGELRFPLLAPVGYAEPYSHIQLGAGTSCTGCHAGESRDTSITFANAFVSQAVRPNFFFQVPLVALQTERTGCGSSPSQRCDFYRALFDHGQVRDTDFPSSIP